MQHTSLAPARPVSPQEFETYRADGAVILRGILPASWIERMRIVVDRALDRPGAGAVEYAQGQGRFMGDFLLWLRDKDFRAFAMQSPLPAIAQALMGSAQVRLFYDQLLVKEPHTREETPWHQDLAYWPMRGDDILSLWIPFDQVTAESGAMRYVKGSHARGVLYAPTPFSGSSGFSDVLASPDLAPFPSASSFLPDAEVLVCEMSPGDVVAHHPLVFHWSPGNLDPKRRRRALALRYFGDDVTFDANAPNFLAHPKLAQQLPEPLPSETGQRPEGANFPIVWPVPA